MSSLHVMESMNRLLIFSTIVTVLFLVGCTRPRKETTMGATPDLASAIVALRSAYAAFNRGDVDAAVEPFDAQMNGPNRRNSQAEAITTGVKP